MGNAQTGNAANLPPGTEGQGRQIPGGGQAQYPGGYIPAQNVPPTGMPPGAYQMGQNNNSNNFPGGSGGGGGGGGDNNAPPPGDYRPFPQQQQQQQQQHQQALQQQQHMYAGSSQIHTQQANIKKSSSDTSMTFMDGEPSLQTSTRPQLTHSQSAPNTEMIDGMMEDETVPTVFRWEHGGRQVYITGTFNGWSRQIPMHRSGNDFTYIHNLKRGKHAFKFIVDDEWRFAPDAPTVADIEGRINNFIDVTDFKPYRGDRDFEKEKAAADYGAGVEDVESNKIAPAAATTTTTVAATATAGDNDTDLVTIKGGEKGKPDRDGEIYSHNMPDMDDYTKEPPPLPPHLRHIILNKPPQLQDTAALPVPQHVALNHLYCTAIKDSMMVLGITQRFKTKFVTTVYYSPCSSK